MPATHLNLDELLGEAYRLYQIKAHKREAAALVQQAVDAEPVIAPHLRDRLAVLRRVAEKRRHGCHVTRALIEILDTVRL
jgi:hypothetical protein